MKPMNKRTKKSTLKHMIIKLAAVDGDVKYTTEDLINVLEKISFDLININLSCKKSLLGLNGNGYAAIGYVNGFDPEECTFKTVVFQNQVEAVEKLGELVVTARVFTKDDKITKVISLDVEPVNA